MGTERGAVKTRGRANVDSTSDSKRVLKSTDSELITHLDLLVQTGHFGSTRAEVAEGLLRNSIRQLYLEGWFKRTANKRGGLA